MNREEARKKYQEETSGYLQEGMELLEQNLLKEEEGLKQKIREVLLRLLLDCQDRDQVQYVQISLLRSRMDEDIYEILLSVHNEAYFLDRKPLMQTVDASCLFDPLKEIRERLYQTLEYYQGKIEKFDADRLIRETAMTFYKKQADHCRVLFRDLDRWGAENEILPGKRLVVKWGGFQEESETVFLTETSEKEQQQFLKHNEKNTLG